MCPIAAQGQPNGRYADEIGPMVAGSSIFVDSVLDAVVKLGMIHGPNAVASDNWWAQ